LVAAGVELADGGGVTAGRRLEEVLTTWDQLLTAGGSPDKAWIPRMDTFASLGVATLLGDFFGVFFGVFWFCLDLDRSSSGSSSE